MFGIEYLIGFINVFVRFGVGVVWAIPINIAWNRLAPVYFSFLPDQWEHIPYWHIVGLYLIACFVGAIVKALLPKIVEVEQKTEASK